MFVGQFVLFQFYPGNDRWCDAQNRQRQIGQLWFMRPDPNTPFACSLMTRRCMVFYFLLGWTGGAKCSHRDSSLQLQSL